MAANLPKLLVATECAPNSAGGGAAVIRQMLKDWPKEKLVWWSCFPDQNRHFGREVHSHHVATIPPRLNPQRRWCFQKSWLLKTFWSPWAARHLQKTISETKPDVIWTIPHGMAILPIAKVLPGQKTGFHVSIHDYADVAGQVARFGGQLSHRMSGLVEELYAGAVSRDVICRPMLEDMRRRTGCDGVIARAGLEAEDFDQLEIAPSPLAGEIRIAYAGTILVEREFALFVKALEKIQTRLPWPVKLDFFGDHSYRARGWFDGGWMQEHGNLPARQLSEALRKCSWGFSPMALTDENPRYNRFSLPTKFVSYMAAGLPVIALGHPESSLIKLAGQYDVGLCSTATTPEELGAQVLRVLSDPHPKQTYRLEILRCARMELDANQMRATLHDNFQKCATVTGELG